MQTLSQFLVGKFIVDTDSVVTEISDLVMAEDGRNCYVVVPQSDGGLDLKSLQSVIGYNYVYPSRLLAEAAAEAARKEYEREEESESA